MGTFFGVPRKECRLPHPGLILTFHPLMGGRFPQAVSPPGAGGGVLGMLLRDTSFDVTQSEGASEHGLHVTLLQQQQTLDPRDPVS